MKSFPTPTHDHEPAATSCKAHVRATVKFVGSSFPNAIHTSGQIITRSTLKKILRGHGHSKFERRIRSLQQFVVQQLLNEKVSEPYEMSVNFRIIIT